jgi:hypothetical protein
MKALFYICCVDKNFCRVVRVVRVGFVFATTSSVYFWAKQPGDSSHDLSPINLSPLLGVALSLWLPPMVFVLSPLLTVFGFEVERNLKTLLFCVDKRVAFVAEQKLL